MLIECLSDSQNYKDWDKTFHNSLYKNEKLVKSKLWDGKTLTMSNGKYFKINIYIYFKNRI